MERAVDSVDAAGGGFRAFVKEAGSAMLGRRVLAPALLLLVALTGSNIVILINIPAPGSAPSWQFFLAAFVRIAGLIVATVAILRLAMRSERGPWRPDGAFCLYMLGIVLSMAASAGIGAVTGMGAEAGDLIVKNIVTTILLAPFATWLVGMAVAVPLGWQSRRFMRNFGRWLVPLIVWSLLLVSPMAVLHALIDFRLIKGVGDLFWPLALFDGALSTLMVLVGTGLNVAAYRLVARD